MKIAVCEDSFEDRSLTKASLSEACLRLKLDIEADYYESGEELIEAVSEGCRYSLIILDIYMDALNGVDTAKKARSIMPDVLIAFLTTSKEYLLEAFDLGAIHYLIKPVTAEAMTECLARFSDRVRVPLSTLEIKSDFKTYSFPLAHVQKIMSGNKGIDVYLSSVDRPSHIPVSFAKAEEQLDPALFLRISRGYIVQMSYILCIDKDICRLKDGSEVLISRGDKTAIRKKYNDFLFRR